MRKQHKLKEKRTIYIVTAKTEKEYFSNFSQEYRVGIKFELIGDATDPNSILNRAKRIKKYSEYVPDLDKIYCVFDRDNFPSFDTVCKTNEKGIELIPSSPCFELWILLHYEKTDRPFLNCGEIITQINKYLPSDYNKSTSQLCFDYIKNDRSQAIENAEWLTSKNLDVADNTTSFTRVHHLVQYLQSISNTASNPS